MPTLKLPQRLPVKRVAIAFFALVILASPALATANVSCAINDQFIRFEMEAIAARSGPIQQVHVGSIEIKPAAMTLAVPNMTFDRTKLLQQWIQDGDLRLHIEVSDDTAQQNVYLVILARHDPKTEKFFGRYVLRVTRDGKTKELKGRIKVCEAG